MGLDPPSTCVHLSLTPSPLRVDVINGWPLMTYNVIKQFPIFLSSSFFQSVCVLGYCVLPLAMASLVCLLMSLTEDNVWVFVVRCVVVLVAFCWSVFGEYDNS